MTTKVEAAVVYRICEYYEHDHDKVLGFSVWRAAAGDGYLCTVCHQACCRSCPSWDKIRHLLSSQWVDLFLLFLPPSPPPPPAIPSPLEPAYVTVILPLAVTPVPVCTFAVAHTCMQESFVRSYHLGASLSVPFKHDRLVGRVVKVSTSRAEGPGFKSRLRRDFFGVKSYQWLKHWHSTGYPARRLAL